jgi:predicted transcriptional regulator
VRCKLRRKTKRAYREMAREIGVAPNTIKKIAKQKLNRVNLKEGRGQLLTEANKLSRLEKATKMLDRINKGKDKLDNIVSLTRDRT